MKKSTHRIYISVMVTVVIVSVIVLTYIGFNYYGINLEERFFHPKNEVLKPSGYLGHGFGIAGSAMIIIGLFSYMARKRFRRFSRLGYLKHWLEFHIFLCILGPVFVLFHTTFKFGGIVAVSFWSMVAVVLSGVIGRFIYIQIPRSVEGRELSLNEINVMKNEGNISGLLPDAFINRPDYSGKSFFARLVSGYKYDNAIFNELRKDLKKQNLTRANYQRASNLLRNEIKLNRKIDMLVSMRNLMEYWHVAHLPFALAMLVVMLIHVAVVITLGYRWIF
ncbi:MAG: hypothetical protein NTV01_18865 [Bacteroidia bacterium]|nr:hypothetical protein [Bacteroidia bacterium]